ncbi:MAG: hypothetical protein QOJ09_1697 [Actinomycetota bacterium]|jgi:hypothetical protein|nr:hypothetical protein [Actinomycetota bacterium]
MTRPRRWAVALLATAVTVAVAGPVWAIGARSRVRAAAASQVAGYGLSALSAAVRYQLNSPGLLPVGDPAEGNIFEVDLPFARSNVTGGPVMGIVSSPMYPGDTASHLGTAFATFDSRAAGFPNYPVVAEANYPPSPGFGQDASFAQPAIPGVGAGTATSHAGPDGATADGQISSLSLPTTAPLIEVGSARATNTVTIKDDLVTSTAESHTGTITIAGLITIADVTAAATASSNGTDAKPAARLDIGKVSVAGQPAYIDADGVHLVGQQPVGSGVAPGVEALLQKTLASDGISIRTVSPHTSSSTGQAVADAGGIVIVLERTVPALGVPGFPSIPGVPVPLGTPDLPLHIEVALGRARVAANATVAPTDTFSTSTDLPFADVSGLSQVADITPSGAGASATGALGLAPSTGVGGTPTLQPAVASGSRPRGSPIPIVWVLAGIVASIVLCGPLLGYARWQLLEGRTR